MLSVTPASPSVGAYIEGVDLRDVSTELKAEIVDAWHRFGVLFFRGQHLSPDEQLDAARIFGEPEFFHFAPAISADQPLVHLIENTPRKRGTGASSWHTDATWLAKPPRGSMLQAITLPPLGGDTLFASASWAYRNLSEPVRSMIDGLTATHFGGAALTRAAKGVGIEIPDEPVQHRVVRIHPATGERCLFVNGLFTQHIDGLTVRESAALLPALCDQFSDPEVQCRFTWEPGDIAIWDNRAVQHYATPDYDELRTMHRVVLAGDPVEGPTN